MGEFAPHDIRVLRQGSEGGRHDFDVVGDARVVISTFCISKETFNTVREIAYTMIGIGLRSATASNHRIMPSCVAAPAKYPGTRQSPQ